MNKDKLLSYVKPTVEVSSIEVEDVMTTSYVDDDAITQQPDGSGGWWS